MKFAATRSCDWCSIEFTPAKSRTKFCTPKCLKARDDNRYYLKHFDKIAAQTKLYKASRKNQYKEYWKRYKSDPEFMKKYNEGRRRWDRKNQPHKNANTALYRAKKRHQTPPWLNKSQRQDIVQIYKIANLLSHKTGILHSVDHIIPLRGKNVSGLHVPWNLQIMTLSENCKKGNRL